MAKAYAEGFIEEYREIAYDAFLCGYGAKCSLEIPKDLGEAAKEYAKAYTDNDNGNGGDDWEDDIKITFQAGAKWQADHTPLPEDTVLFNKGVAEGKRLMMKEAVEGEVDFEYFGYKVIRPDLKQLDTLLESMNHGDKVHIIIVKED